MLNSNQLNKIHIAAVTRTDGQQNTNNFVGQYIDYTCTGCCAMQYLSLIVGCAGQHFQHLCKKLVHDSTRLIACGQQNIWWPHSLEMFCTKCMMCDMQRCHTALQKATATLLQLELQISQLWLVPANSSCASSASTSASSKDTTVSSFSRVLSIVCSTMLVSLMTRVWSVSPNRNTCACVISKGLAREQHDSKPWESSLVEAPNPASLLCQLLPAAWFFLSA